MTNEGKKLTLPEIKEQFIAEKTKYEEAKKAFDGLEEKLESEFKAKLPSLLSEDEKDVLDLDGDPVKQWEILFSKYKENVLIPIEQERKALETYEDELNKKEMAIAALEAVEKFKEQNPDVDFETIEDWYENDLPNREKQKILKEAGGDHLKFMELIRDKWLEVNGNKNKAQEPKLPKDINSIAGTSGDLDKGSDDEVDVSSLYERR